MALCVLFAHTLVLLERWLATTTTTGPNRTPEERCKEHCTANCNEYTSAVDSRLGAHPCTMRSSDAMRAVELRSLPASFLVCELHGLACMRTACCNELGNAMRCEETKRGERRARRREAKKQAARAARRPPPPPRRGLAAPLTTPPLPSPSPPGPAASLPHVRQPWRVPSRSCCFAQQPPASPRRTSGKLLGLCIHHRGVVQ